MEISTMPNTVPAADTGLPKRRAKGGAAMLMDPLPRFVGVNDDPAFAAIKTHHAAVKQTLDALLVVEAAERAARDTQNASVAWLYREAEKAHAAAEQAERQATRAMARTRPTTS